MTKLSIKVTQVDLSELLKKLSSNSKKSSSVFNKPKAKKQKLRKKMR